MRSFTIPTFGLVGQSHFSEVHLDCITLMSYANPLASLDRVLG
jgi:hypothetical protein